MNSYGNSNAVKGSLGLHRLVEAMKHMFAVRMNLGDPNFVDVSKFVSEMLSPSFAKEIQQKIFDNTTFPPEYYMSRFDPFNSLVDNTANIGFSIIIISQV